MQLQQGFEIKLEICHIFFSLCLEVASFSIRRLQYPKPFPDISPWTFYGQLSEEFAKERRISFHLWVPILTLTNKYLMPIHKSFDKFMSVIPQPVNDYSVLKAYLLFLVDTTENLEIQHTFSKSDQAVYSNCSI